MKFLTSNKIKLLALITMLFDHIGIILFPQVVFFRVIGRLSFPLFAFMISEGAKYTRNRLRYFLVILGSGLVCQIPYMICLKSDSLNIFITFSFSIIIIYALDFFKKCLFNKNCKVIITVLAGVLFLGSIAFAYLAPRVTGYVSYGFYGILCAPFASGLTTNRIKEPPQWLKKLDNIPLRVLCMLIPLAYYNIRVMGGGYNLVALLSLVFLLFYNEKRGELKIKYLFYAFYPVHLIILYLISLLIK